MTVQKPYRVKHSALFKLIDQSLVLENTDEIDRFDVAAVILKQTYGVPVFCTCSKQDMAELGALVVGAGVNADRFLTFARLKEGRLKGNVPRFSFSSRNMHLVTSNPRFRSSSPEQVALLSCFAGISKADLYELACACPDYDPFPFLFTFLAEPSMQIQHLHTRMLDAYKRGGKSKAVAISRAHHVSFSSVLHPTVASVLKESESLRAEHEAFLSQFD